MLKKETVLSGAEHPGTKLEILQSPAGYYLGFRDKDGLPYSRESDYLNERSARMLLSALRTGDHE